MPKPYMLITYLAMNKTLGFSVGVYVSSPYGLCVKAHLGAHVQLLYYPPF